MLSSTLRRLSRVCLLLFLLVGPVTAAGIDFFNTAQPQVLANLDTAAPGFVAEQKAVVRNNYPLFIFVPGIIGSQLERTTEAGTTMLWGRYDASNPDLSIKDGDDTAIKASVLYDFKVWSLTDVDAYASGIREITTAQLDVELLMSFPYDWRQDNRRTAERLNAWLCDADRYAQIKDREIRFIGHSMGGLVVKEWFRRYDGKPTCPVAGSATPVQRPLTIKEVIFLGTPHFGAPAAIRTLVDGFFLVAKRFGGMIGYLSGLLDKQTVAKALNEHGTLFPSAYQLLPIYHEHDNGCMNSYGIGPDSWPPHIADIENKGDKFAVFDAKAWQTFNWPKQIPSSMTRDQYYQYLATTLPEAKAFLCKLAQYKFPPGIKVKYFASNSGKTDAAFEIRNVSSWILWKEWSLVDVGRPPWTDGDGTVPKFVARNTLALGFPTLEDADVTERHDCQAVHSSLLTCPRFADHIRDVILAAKRAQAIAAKQYLDSRPTERAAVLQTLADASVYFDCRLQPGEFLHAGAEVTACPLNDEIRQSAGKSAATLLAETRSAPTSADKPAFVEVAASMQGLEPPQRVDAAEAAAVAALEAGQLNRGHEVALALAGGKAASEDAFRPLQIADNIFFTTPVSNKVVALTSGDNASVAWTHVAQHDPGVVPVMCCEPPSEGQLAYADGKIIKYYADTTLVALDAKSGQELWKTRTGDPLRGEVGDRTPYIIGDKVLVGVSGAEFGARDSVASLDLKTGKPQWQAYAKGSDTDILFNPQTTMAEGKPVGKDWSLKTWTGDQWRMSGGAQNSNTVIDPELKLIYYVASDSAPYQPQARKQASAHTLFARDLDTGEARWIYPLPAIDEPGDIELSLAEKDIKGEKRKVVDYRDMAGNLISLDRAKGELLESLKTKAWADAPEQFPRFDAMP